MTTRRVAGLAGLGLGLAGLGLGAGPGSLGAQPPGADAAKPPAGAGYYAGQDLGVSCGGCHSAPSPSAALEGRDKYVLLREYEFWQQHDLHRRAYDGLTSELGKAMSRRLYGDPAAAATKPACLVCHSTDTSPGKPLADKTPDDFGCSQDAAKNGAAQGVNCQGCHGPGTGWLNQHFQLAWRDVAPADKAALGLVNLRDPAVRAEVCASCHVGSADKGRFVTHEMYAAGHPPLPPFELATFSRDEPKHWRSPGDVEHIQKVAAKDKDRARDLFGYRAGEVEAARLVAVGALTNLKEMAALVKFEPDPATAGEPLDFAHFNCSACHHDLRYPSDRQRNGYAGVPGRPVPHTWPVWAVRAVARQADAGGLGREVDDAYAKLRAAYDARPFGDKMEVRAAADRMAAACDKLQGVVAGLRYDEPAARALMAALAEEAAAAAAPPAGGPARRDFLDPDGATQLARSVAAVYADVARGPGPRRLDAAAKPPAGPPAFPKADPNGLADVLRQLDADVGLAARYAYPNGIGTDGAPLPDAAGYLLQAGDRLGGRLKRSASYKTADLKDKFGDLARRLNGAGGR